MDQIPQVVLLDSTSDPLFTVYQSAAVWSMPVHMRYVLFITGSLPFRSLISYLFRDDFGYSVFRLIGWPRLVIL
jgi:hypothetical protein